MIYLVITIAILAVWLAYGIGVGLGYRRAVRDMKTPSYVTLSWEDYKELYCQAHANSPTKDACTSIPMLLTEIEDRACSCGFPGDMHLIEFTDYLRGLFPEHYKLRDINYDSPAS